MKKVSPTAGAVRNGCLVYEQQGQNVIMLVDTPSWYAWLETATTFTFTCKEGTFTAHKARAGNRRGGWYWRAYRRKRGRLSRCYLGVPTNITLAKLHEVARCLAADGENTGKSQTDEDAPSPVHLPLASQGLTSTVILQSTITPPRLPVQHVARPRLLALLEQDLRGPVTLISAPAGSGKTTLLAEWAATTARPVAWLSCEEGENDPARFLSSLIAALARVDARLDITAQTERPWHPDAHERVLTRLLNDLERVLQHDIVLILDDVHALTTEVSQELLLFLLNHLPSRLHLLIGTRVNPPRLARLRACQQIAELRREALGFVSAEVEAFAQALLGASVSLSLALIWTQPLRTSEPPDPEQVTQHLTALLEVHAQDDPELQGALQRELALHQAAQALAQGNIPLALSHAASATHSLTGLETAWTRFTLWRQQALLGAAYRARGDLRASEQMWRNASPASGTLPNHLIISRLDDLYEEQGRLRELGRLYEDVFRSCREQRDPPLLLLSWAHWRSGVLLCEWNRLQEAEAAAQQLLALDSLPELARPSPGLTLLGLGVLARVALAQGKSEQARQILESEAFDVARFPIPQATKDLLILAPVRLALACG